MAQAVDYCTSCNVKLDANGKIVSVGLSQGTLGQDPPIYCRNINDKDHIFKPIAQQGGGNGQGGGGGAKDVRLELAEMKLEQKDLALKQKDMEVKALKQKNKETKNLARRKDRQLGTLNESWDAGEHEARFDREREKKSAKISQLKEDRKFLGIYLLSLIGWIVTVIVIIDNEGIDNAYSYVSALCFGILLLFWVLTGIPLFEFVCKCDCDCCGCLKPIKDFFANHKNAERSIKASKIIVNLVLDSLPWLILKLPNIGSEWAMLCWVLSILSCSFLIIWNVIVIYNIGKFIEEKEASDVISIPQTRSAANTQARMKSNDPPAPTAPTTNDINIVYNQDVSSTHTNSDKSSGSSRDRSKEGNESNV